MSLLFAILLWALVIILAGFIALIVTPVHLEVRLAAAPQVSVRCDMRALGGWAPPVTVFNTQKPKAPAPKAPKTRQAKQRRWAKSSVTVQPKRVIKAAVRLVRDVLRRIHFARLEVDFDFGLADPADTGQVAGIVMAFEHGLPPSDRILITARPNFHGACFEGNMMAAIRLTAGAFILPGVRFAWQAFGPAR